MDNYLLYHYTSTDAFVGMINGGKALVSKDMSFGKEKVLSFWANSVYTMNDPSEMMYGYGIVKEMIEKADKKKILTSYYNQINISDYDEEQKKAFFKDHFFNEEKTPFAISLSCVDDNFSEEYDNEDIFMWSMYGDSGKGLRLGFDKDVLAHNGCVDSGTKAFPICYDINAFEDYYYQLLLQQVMDSYKELAEIKNVTDIILKKVEIISSIFPLFCSFVKNPKYKKEKEWRIVNFTPSTSFPDVKFRTRNGLIIPYVERYVPIKYLKEIIIGPCCDFELQRRNIKMILKSCDIEIQTVRVSHSKIPYRNMK